MPKRYRIVRGSKFTWEYINEDTDPWELLAESHERWDTPEEVKAEIAQMSGRESVEGRDEKPKPKEKNRRIPIGSKEPKD
jgi:hypothetical protein